MSKEKSKWWDRQSLTPPFKTAREELEAYLARLVARSQRAARWTGPDLNFNDRHAAMFLKKEVKLLSRTVARIEWLVEQMETATKEKEDE